VSEYDLDNIDQKIVQALVKNARLPMADLARKVNLSRNAVRHRVEKLERAHVITGYKAVLGLGRPADSGFIAVIRVYRQDRMRGADVIKMISEFPEVKSCYVMSGEDDLMLKVQASSNDRIHEIWQAISEHPGVLNTTTSFVMSSLFEKD